MSRLPPLADEELTVEQRRVRDMVASSRSGMAAGPFLIWLRKPELAEQADRFGQALRANSALKRQHAAMTTLLVAHDYRAEFMWAGQKARALIAGLSEDLIDAIENDRQPEFTDAKDDVVFTVVRELLATKNLSDESFARAEAHLAELELIELVALVGQYCSAALTLNAFRVPALPDEQLRQIKH